MSSNPTGLIYADGKPIPAAHINAQKMSAFMGGHTNYRGASMSTQEGAHWYTAPLSGESAAKYEREILAQRAQDLIRNDGRASSGLRKSAQMVIGAGWRLAANVDWLALGLTKERGKKLNQILESVWTCWADDPFKRCDAERHENFGGLQNLLYRHLKGDGDALTVVRFRDRAVYGGPFGTCLQIIDPARLSNPRGAPDTETLRGGIEFDNFGAATAYHIRDAHPGDYWSGVNHQVWTRLPRETLTGRPVVIHGFDKDRAGQTRGVTSFAPIIAAFKGLSRYSDAELKTATLGAMFGAFVTSGFDASTMADVLASPGEIAEASNSIQDTRIKHHEKYPAVMEGTRIPILFPGDKVELNTTQRDSTGFEGFTKIFLQMISSALDVSYPQLSQDWDISFSAARAALNDAWSAVTARRKSFASQMIAPIYLAVLEEAITNRADDFNAIIPNSLQMFYVNPAAFCRADWIGPGRGSINPLQDAQAAILEMRSGQTSLARVVREKSGAEVSDIASEQGAAIAEFESEGIGLSFAANIKLSEETPDDFANNDPDNIPDDSTPKRERENKRLADA